MIKELTKGDISIFVVALGFVLSLYVIFWSTGGDARHAHVNVVGKKQVILDLKEEISIKVEGVLGVSIIEVKDGKVRFVESPCSNKVCIRSGWLSQVNSLAACLPNGVSLYLVGSKARFDSINF